MSGGVMSGRSLHLVEERVVRILADYILVNFYTSGDAASSPTPKSIFQINLYDHFFMLTNLMSTVKNTQKTPSPWHVLSSSEYPAK